MPSELPPNLLLGTGFAYLAADVLPGVSNTLALVRFHRPESANPGSGFAQHFYIDPLQPYGVTSVHAGFYSLRQCKLNGMRIPQAQVQIASLHLGPVAGPLNLESLCETFTHAPDHVVHQGTHQPVGGMGLLGIALALELD